MPYTRLHYHLVWTTRGRAPLLDAESQAIVRASIRETATFLRLVVHAIGLMPDHVHVAVSLPPSIPVAEVVRRFKGASSFVLNQTARAGSLSHFAWQSEYGAHTVGPRALADVIAYVDNQPARHAAGDIHHGLERITDPSPRP